MIRLRRLLRGGWCQIRVSSPVTVEGRKNPIRIVVMAIMRYCTPYSTRELIHARVTAHANSKWLSQPMVEACGISREPPRYLIHDRDGCFGASFNRRVASFNIRQIRTPVKAPKANSIAERWVRTIRNECLDHRLIFGHYHLQRTVDEYLTYYNRWRPHRSLGQIAPCPHVREISRKPARHLISKPVLGGLHHVYQWAA